MFSFSLRLLFLCGLSIQLFAEKIETFYGPFEVDEPVLIDLIHSHPMQRLKGIHQYGVSYYTTHREEYSRYDHSLGVFVILRAKGASLEEQIAGLLHDVSHTAFSHTGDWVFGREFQEGDYQSTIQRMYLTNSGIARILNKYGYTVDQVLANRAGFLMLEQPLPDLCADRIDYNIQGAFHRNFLTKDECLAVFEELVFKDGHWSLSTIDHAAKLMRFSLYMTENCWGSPLNYVTSRWLADAILRGLKIGLISWDDLHFGEDQTIWDKLSMSKDPIIQTKMRMLATPDEYFQLVEANEASTFVKFRCRGIDPWIQQDGALVRLTQLDVNLEEALRQVKERSLIGWPIEIRTADVLAACVP